MIVLVLVVDSLRGDAPGFAGGEALTPTMDALAASGTSYSQALASGGWTVPSLNALAAGTFPHRIGVARWRHPYPQRRPTLFTAFEAAGFAVSSFFHNPRWAFANTQARGTPGDSQDCEAVCAALRGPRGSDRMVFVHHWWTHLPYVTERMDRRSWKSACDGILGDLARDPTQQRPRSRRAYLDTVQFLDRELLGRYLDAAHHGGDDVLVCVTADHGENWGESLPKGRRVEHIYDLHGRWLTDDTTHVPLVFAGGRGSSKVPAAQRLAGLARGVDVAPTICALAGVPWPGPLSTATGPTLLDRGVAADGGGLILDGVSLAEGMAAGTEPVCEAALTVTSHNAVEPAKYPREGKTLWRRYSLRTASTRYVWDGVDGGRQLQGPDGALVPSGGRLSGLRDALTGARSLYQTMAAERRRAISAGSKLDKELFPGVGDDDAALDDSEAQDLQGSLRMLGYME